ncbi:MAG TPA: isochorismatase family protein [Vicinamibacterales bacterium]|nr:isochorismatase family protein [Vicinamibacterales bacterium]
MSPDHTALLVVDAQNDFCAGGALAVPNAEQVIPALNRHIADAVAHGRPVYVSRDWHPGTSTHFAPYGGPWPVHCVQDTDGARFHPDLQVPDDVVVITKGIDPQSPGYSAFEGRTRDETPLATDLQQRGIQHLLVGGLATDYCVRHSVLDALSAGFTVTVLGDAIAGVDAADSERAVNEMRTRGATVR